MTLRNAPLSKQKHHKHSRHTHETRAPVVAHERVPRVIYSNLMLSHLLVCCLGGLPLYVCGCCSAAAAHIKNTLLGNVQTPAHPHRTPSHTDGEPPVVEFCPRNRHHVLANADETGAQLGWTEPHFGDNINVTAITKTSVIIAILPPPPHAFSSHATRTHSKWAQ